MKWNTLDVPLETGWQCTLFPVKQYDSMMRRGYDEMSARWLYPNAGQDDWPSWNIGSSDEREKRRRWKDDVCQQLAEDQRTFTGYFRPNLDLRSITGENALRAIQNYVRDFLDLAHWDLPTDNAGVRMLLCDAVSSGRLVPVVNREYSGLPRVAQPDPAPQRWPATLNPLPNLGAPAKVDDDDFDLLGVVESVAGALLGGGDNNSDSGAFEEDAFSSYSVESTPLSDAQPFEYSEDMPEGGSFDIAKTPNEGDPGTWYTNPGSGQMRMYGENGQPVVDFDFDHDHGQGVPHAHNWDNGARGPGVAFSPL
ncbi:MAG TPA: hypothetical protein VF534_26485 [Paraburkholderia sp.]